MQIARECNGKSIQPTEAGLAIALMPWNERFLSCRDGLRARLDHTGGGYGTQRSGCDEKQRDETKKFQAR
jgi:hypothetical protein